MPAYRESIGSRILLSVILVAALALALPQPALAAPHHDIVLSFDVVAVKKNESVTLKLKDFPVRTKFTVKIGKVGKKAVDGSVVADFTTEKAGTFEKTFAIPENLKDQLIIAIRVDSVDHYSAENWFFNQNKSHPVTAADQKPVLIITEVKKDTGFTLEAKNLVPDTSYLLRIGPHYSFYRDYVIQGTFTSDASGVIKTQVEMPKLIKEKTADYVMVRLDGAATYTVASFKNVDGGTVANPSSLVKAVFCRVINLNVIKPMQPGEQFDVIWTVQNTGPIDWVVDDLLYRWVGGEKTHKYADWFPVGWTVKRGWSFNITVDMIAPQEVGWHRTTWALALDDFTLCNLPVSFAVEGK